MLLVVVQVGIDRIVVVEYLYLHTVVCGVGSYVSAHADTVVHAGLCKAEIKTEHEIAVLLVRIEVAASAPSCGYDDFAVLGGVVGLVALPFFERAAVEQYFEAFFFLFGREFEHRCRGKFVD